MESLINPPALGYPNYQIPFFLFVHEKKGNTFGVLTQKHRDHHRPLKYCNQQLDLWLEDTPLALEPLLLQTHLFVKATEVTVMGSPLTIFVSHAEALRNSHHTWHLSVTLLPMKSLSVTSHIAL